jgi:segregation and condensation protein B
MSDPKESKAQQPAEHEMPAATDETTIETVNETEISDTDAGVDDAADPAAHDDVELDDAIEPEPEEKGDPYGGHDPQALKRILEAALFASGATLSVSHLRDLFEKHERPHGRIIRQSLAELIAAYENQGVQLIEVASGYRFQTDADTAPWISRLWDEKPQKYSRALMETIALIAYRQPITRGEIEDVRGVAVSSNIIRTLLERDWVRVVGHRDVPGRPAMYATTRQFLDYFGLNSLDQLPHLSEIRDMDELDPQMKLNESGEGEPVTEDEKTQSEISFSDMIDKLRESEQSGKTGSEYLDEQLDDELAAMDEVNTSFEQAMEQQRAEHEHPDLDLEEDDLEADSETESETETETEDIDTPIAPEPIAEGAETSPDADENETLSEQEQWKIIQEKLAQQQALLDARESDQPREDEEDE